MQWSVKHVNVDTVQPTRDVGTMLGYCWPTVFDAGSTINRRWADVTCLLEAGIVKAGGEVLVCVGRDILKTEADINKEPPNL